MQIEPYQIAAILGVPTIASYFITSSLNRAEKIRDENQKLKFEAVNTSLTGLKDEIGKLGAVITKMTDGLEKRTDSLEQKHEDLAMIVARLQERLGKCEARHDPGGAVQ